MSINLSKPSQDQESLNSAKKPGEKKKITIAAVIAFIVAFALSFTAMQYFFKDQSVDTMLNTAASELNKNCPLTIDRDTRLDNALVLPNNTFQYNYTLISMLKAEVNTDELHTYLEPRIINGVRTSPDMKEFRENEVTIVYNYVDKNGEFLFKIEAGPQIYKD